MLMTCAVYILPINSLLRFDFFRQYRYIQLKNDLVELFLLIIRRQVIGLENIQRIYDYDDDHDGYMNDHIYVSMSGFKVENINLYTYKYIYSLLFSIQNESSGK